MLKNQLQKGNNGLTKRKYITFGIEADDLRTAKMRLERIETDVLANFKTLGVQARSLNGLERLELLHSQLHPDGQEKFHSSGRICLRLVFLPKTSFPHPGCLFQRMERHSG